jgi:hypothetical protein
MRKNATAIRVRRRPRPTIGTASRCHRNTPPHLPGRRGVGIRDELNRPSRIPRRHAIVEADEVAAEFRLEDLRQDQDRREHLEAGGLARRRQAVELGEERLVVGQAEAGDDTQRRVEQQPETARRGGLARLGVFGQSARKAATRRR